MKRKNKNNTIVLTGGDTGGPVAPLLALSEAMQKGNSRLRFVFVGTHKGVERHMAKNFGIPFFAISAAKFRRYNSIKNLFAPFQLLLGLIQAYRVLKKTDPLCVVGAGGFVQVPVVWAAWLLGIPVFIHQQDVVPSLSNKLSAPLACRVTVSFKESLQHFPHAWMLGGLDRADRIVWTGNPVRLLKLPSREKAHAYFKLVSDFPTVLVMGGGSGAASLNELIVQSLPELTKFLNVIHVTGKGKKLTTGHTARYSPHEFIDSMEYAYAAADFVLCRAGLSTITELAAYKKPAILVALPGSQQEQNALYLSEQKAVLAIEQTLLNTRNLPTFLRSFLFEYRLQKDLATRLHALMPNGAAGRMARVIFEALGE